MAGMSVSHRPTGPVSSHEPLDGLYLTRQVGTGAWGVLGFDWLHYMLEWWW